MGMLETWMKKVPEDKQPHDFYKEVHSYMGDYAEGADGYEIKWVTLDNFEECWEEQENLKRNSDVYNRYKLLAQNGKVVFVQIDW
jgi:hypothetical protein